MSDPNDNGKALFDAGVKEYSAAGRYYYDIGFKPTETQVLAAFRISPQDGVSFEEAAAAVTAESSFSTWTTVWSDYLVEAARYSARTYEMKSVPGHPDQMMVYIAYPLDLFEEGSMPNLMSSIVGNVFGFKPCALCVWKIYISRLRCSKHSRVRLTVFKWNATKWTSTAVHCSARL